MFSNSISNDINSMPYFMVETFFQPESNSIITSVPVYKIKKRFEEVKSNFTDIEFAEYIEKHKDLYKVYLESENTDNPILIVYKLKNKL